MLGIAVLIFRARPRMYALPSDIAIPPASWENAVRALWSYASWTNLRTLFMRYLERALHLWRIATIRHDNRLSKWIEAVKKRSRLTAAASRTWVINYAVAYKAKRAAAREKSARLKEAALKEAQATPAPAKNAPAQTPESRKLQDISFAVLAEERLKSREEDLLRAIQAAPRDPKLYRELGELYERMGNGVDAREALAAALKLEQALSRRSAGPRQIRIIEAGAPTEVPPPDRPLVRNRRRKANASSDL